MSGTGPTNALTDVAGIRVGHATRRGDGWLTGTTVVLPDPTAPSAGWTCAAAARAPARPTCSTRATLVERVHAVVLTGGSAYGLAAADGVMHGPGRRRRRLPGGRGRTRSCRSCPAAVIFDLGRGGDFASRPDATLGAEALPRPLWRRPAPRPCRQGGRRGRHRRRAGQLKGGIGSASAVLADGTTVAALVVVNPVGSTVDPDDGRAVRRAVRPARRVPCADSAVRRGRASGARPGVAAARPGSRLAPGAGDDDRRHRHRRHADQGAVRQGRRHRPRRHGPGDPARCTRCSTATRCSPWRPARARRPGRPQLHGLLDAAADCVTRAIGHAVLAAETVQTPVRQWRSYRDAFPSAFPAAPTVSDEGGHA